MKLLDKVAQGKVLILGLGREGTSSLKYLRSQFPDQVFGLADRLPFERLSEKSREIIQSAGKTRLHLGESYLESLQEYDLVFRSPGIPPTLPQLAQARQSGKTITSNTQLFFDLCPGTIVGITGTMGKSTTASLTYQILRDGRVDVCLTGNIGIPPLSSLENATSDTVFVVELSSHQLMDLERSPHIAVILAIAPDHGDYYEDFETYVQAKAMIVQEQTPQDYVIYNASNPFSAKIVQKSVSQRIAFDFEPRGDDCCFLQDEFLVFRSAGSQERVLSTHQITLVGRFNLLNVMPALVVGKLFGIQNKSISASTQDFKPLDHRLELAGTVDGVTFYNDSLSTTPETTIATLDSFPGRSIILLAGGFDRGQDYTELARTILQHKIKAVVLFPTTGERLWRDITSLAKNDANLPRHLFVETMDEAMDFAWKLSRKGDVVLLSPAGPSFATFVNYEDRGNQFKEAIRRFSNSKQPRG